MHVRHKPTNIKEDKPMFNSDDYSAPLKDEDCAKIKERVKKLQQAARHTIEKQAAQDLEDSKHGLSYWLRRFGIK